MSDNKRAIQQTMIIAASPDKVFKALTDARELTRWWITRGTSDAHPGGRFEYVFEFKDPKQNGKQSGAYLEVVANQKLSYPWEAGEFGGGNNTTVVFALSEVEGGTRLELDHAGYGSDGAWGPVYDMTAQAWGFFLGNLKTYLEAGQDNRSAVLGQITHPAA